MRIRIAGLLLLCAVQLHAAPALVGSKLVAGAGSGANNSTITTSYTVQSGNLLIVFCAASRVAGPITQINVSDDSTAYTLDQYITHSNASGEAFSISHLANASAGSKNISCQAVAPGGGTSTTDRGLVIGILEYSGYGTSIIGDGSNLITGLGSSAAPSIGELQAANSNVLLVSGFSTQSTSGSCITSPGSGWTMALSNSDATTYQCAGVMTRLVQAGNYTASATVASADWVIGIAPFVPSGSTPTVATSRETVVSTSSGIWASNMNGSNGATSNVFTASGKQFVGWYASDRTVRISAIDVATQVVTTYDPGLPASSDNDVHRSISIGVDSSGYIHLTYGMHDSALIYYKSAAPLDPTAFSSPLSMIGACETQQTFGEFLRNPTNGELYYTWACGGGYLASNQRFIHYSTSTGWETVSGLTNGILTNYSNAGGYNAFITAPQWAPDGTLWFNWILATGGCSPNQYCIGGEYLLGWTGSSWIKFSGAAQTMPVTQSNASPVYSIGDPTTNTDLGVLNGFSIDKNGVFFLPYKNLDAGGILQQYVLESSTGSFVSHRLTQNAVAYNPPNPNLFTGTTQSPTSVSLGECTYVIYSEIYRQRQGTKAVRSCNSFSTTTEFYLTLNFNPNWILFPDQVMQASGQVSFLFSRANDTSLMFTYLNNFSVQLGRVSMMTWSPGGSGASGNVLVSGNSRVQ